MKLQDVLHYYIGCKMLYSSHHEPQNEPYVLTFENIKEAIEFADRPILRRLSDLTDAEAITIASMAFFDRDAGYPVRDYTTRRQPMGNYPPSACQVAINNDWHDMEIVIGFNTGNIWYSKGEHRVFNQPKIFHYLLSQHFDLFNLIDNGLAIDAKTIQS
jgi:hypothetical protein